ncbi:hypothetical protein GDO86_002436 [Hymenochirus boettgeri]|uniref:Mitochondrial ribosomal protein S30 n=1 Tax=Hymenochirus boettgeri TaxID=247094 RepID=A0A8T2KK14_9PIPI|nr:hypothetical protein GDO86_002436 [Hymenochirus boettgeri]
MAAHRIVHLVNRDAGLPAHLIRSPAPVPPSNPTSLYPPIVASLTAKSKAARRRRVEEHYRLVRDAGSVSDRLKLITGLQRLKYVVYPQTFALNADRWYQHFTKTVYLPGMPAVKGPGPSIGDTELSEIKSLVCENLLQEFHYVRKGRGFLYRDQELSTAPFLTSLVSALSCQCAGHNPVLAQGALDLKPQVNFYWFRGDTVVPRGKRKGRIDPIRFQIDDKPLVQIRIPKQLPEFVPLDHTVPEDVPVIKYEPSRLPLFKRQYENNVFTGSRIEDPCKFGHTQLHLVPDRFKRERLKKSDLGDQIEVFLRANAIASLFAWTGAQAMYQGFWSQDDVTRPFVSQGIISDGKYFSFFRYQLNTLALSADSDKNPSRKNICWGTQSSPLYESIDGNDIKGFNDAVFKQLVEFFLYSPQ